VLKFAYTDVAYYASDLGIFLFAHSTADGRTLFIAYRYGRSSYNEVPVSKFPYDQLYWLPFSCKFPYIQLCNRNKYGNPKYSPKPFSLTTSIKLWGFYCTPDCHVGTISPLTDHV